MRETELQKGRAAQKAAPAMKSAKPSPYDESAGFEFHRLVIMGLAVWLGLTLTGVFIYIGHGYAALMTLAIAGLSTGVLIGRHERDEKYNTYMTHRLKTMPVTQQTEFLQDEIWELRETNEHYRSLIERSGDIVIERDAQDRIIYLNESAETLLADHSNLVVGQTLDLDRISANYNDISVNGEGDLDLQLNTVRGPCWFSWREIVVRDENNRVSSTLTVAQDISNRKAHETALTDAKRLAEEANTAKSRFLATVSHEIRTPLNGVLGMTGLLLETELTPEQRNYAEITKSSSLSLLDLIDELLDISRIEANRFELNPEATDLRDLMEKLVELFAPKAHSKDLELAIDIHHALPDRVLLDGPRLRQVLLNLVGNAVKFTETGGVRLELAVSDGPDDQHCSLRFSVRDTGPGIAIEPVEAVFDEFRQADDGPTRIHGGSGLGLSITRRIIRLMDSDIQVETSSEGSQFEFTLAVPIVETCEAGDPVLKARCLVVWDQKFEAAALGNDLKKLGMSVDCVSSLSEVNHRKPADLVLFADDGVTTPKDLITTCQSRFGGSCLTSVILSPDQRLRLKAWQASGIDSYLIRPIRFASLKKILSNLLVPDLVIADSGSPEPIPSVSGSTEAEVSLRVLIVEDNDVNALLVTTLLQKMGHKPSRVADGDAGIMAARDGSYDLILMDLHMPRVDGLTALEEIRAIERDKGFSLTPVFALTADVSSVKSSTSTGDTFDAFLTKPIDPDTFRTAVRTLVQPE